MPSNSKLQLMSLMNTLNTNKKTQQYLLFFASFFLLTAVILGAMGAHALKPLLSPDQMESFKTGIRYQFIHGIVVFFLPTLHNYLSEKTIRWASILFLIGIVLFSCSIYLLTIKGLIVMPSLSILGPVTPIGGLFLIAGWVLLCWNLIRKK